MTTQKKIIESKLNLLKLGAYLGNVNKRGLPDTRVFAGHVLQAEEPL